MNPVLVIGAGVAGISACLHISKSCPGRQISIISHHLPMAPSDDYSKIVRVDYENQERMEEAQRAQGQWKKTDSYAQYYTECGRVVAYEKDSPTLIGIDRNREQLGLNPRQRGNKELFQSHFGPTGLPDTLTFVYNPEDAVVDWQPCIRDHENAAKEACRQTGGFVYETKADLLKHDGEKVTAVILNNRPIDTRNMDIILAVGPWTVELLGKSLIKLPPLDRVPTPTGIFAFELELNDDQVTFFKNKPAFSHIGRAEFLPPTGENRKAKITWIEPFTMSPIRDVSESALASRTLEDAVEWARQTFPRLEGAKVTRIRFYCDGVTTTQAPLIAKHPAFKNLLLDCGGSYTRAKDLPTNGAYTAHLLNGGEGCERFSWGGSTSSGNDQPHLVAKVDFESLDEQARGLFNRPCANCDGAFAII